MAAVDQAVLDVMEAGKAFPPKMDDEEWRLFQEGHERAALASYEGLTEQEAAEVFGSKPDVS